MTDDGGTNADDLFVRHFSVLNFSVLVSSAFVCFEFLVFLSSARRPRSMRLTAEFAKKLGAAFGRNQIDPTDF
jgi:hypothetical protein